MRWIKSGSYIRLKLSAAEELGTGFMYGAMLEVGGLIHPHSLEVWNYETCHYDEPIEFTNLRTAKSIGKLIAIPRLNRYLNK
jgi:hypothetical protein